MAWRAGWIAGAIALAGCARVDTIMTVPPPGAKTSAADVGNPAVANAPVPAKSPAISAMPELPKSRLQVLPENIVLAADDIGWQLQASQIDGTAAHDVTARVRWEVEPDSLATVEPGGYLRPKSAGSVKIRAMLESASTPSLSAQVTATITPRTDRGWSFAQDIVPIFTRMGCNTGSCHGRADGQNGFHLSLFGYDPAADYQSVARSASQRRLSTLAPGESLLLAKAVGRVMHGGGRRLDPGSDEYATLLGWIKAGAPERQASARRSVIHVRVEPNQIHLEEPSAAQLRVIARFSDGHERDVTRLSTYRVNDDGAARVDGQGLVTLLRRAETDVIVRYQSHVMPVRVSTVINPGLAFDFSKLERRNFIDDQLFRRLESLKVPPSPRSDDAAFLRRVSLDLTGEQPEPEQVRTFLADKGTDKRRTQIDRLLGSQEFVWFWRIKLGDLLQISPARQNNGAYRYQAWIDRCLVENQPWDTVVKTLLTAVGDPTDIETGGPVNYAVDAPIPTAQAELTAQRFLGLRMRCAQCHDHPFDVWTQDAYYDFAAFFAKVEIGGRGMMAGRPRVTINSKGRVLHPRTQKEVSPRQLDGTQVKVADTADPRKALADWIVAPQNPYFAKATVNWVWAQLFGKGLVDPPDDMSRANPPVHPELLDALAKHFVAHKFDLKDLIRTIASSEAYGLSSAVRPGNENDTRLFARHLPRPLTAHQMADALAQATAVPNRFGNSDELSRKLPRRAIEIPNPDTASAILDTFGRCPRTVTCSTIPTPSLSLRQALLLIGGDVIESKVSSVNGYLAGVLKLELEPEELVENLYFRTVCRAPTAEESSHWSAELKQASSLSEAAEDLFWALLNSREFAFNH
jgi:hypothetical protein